jgi:putative DNA primase/helicase
MTDDLPDEMGQPILLDFDPDAADALYSHAQELEDRNTPTSDLRTLGGWVGKLPAQLARIAAVLALSEDPTRTTVPLEYVENALSLSDSLIRHALSTFAVMRNSEQEDPARRVIATLRKLRAPDVSTRQVQQEIRGQAWVKSGKVDAVREALEDLADLGYVRPVTVKTGGRPSERWLVHPDLLG